MAIMIRAARRGLQAALPALRAAAPVAAAAAPRGLFTAFRHVPGAPGVRALPAVWANRGGRSFASSPDEDLRAIVHEELEYENSTYVVPEEVGKGAPSPWSLVESDNNCEMQLVRDHGSEKIVVTVVANSKEFEDPFPEEGEEEDEEELEPAIDFSVTVTKGTKSMIFDCVGDADDVTIHSVEMEALDSDDEETIAYGGPEFAQLDQALQDAFQGFLAQRGVDEALAGYLQVAVADKEQREYMDWLKDVHNFLE